MRINDNVYRSHNILACDCQDCSKIKQERLNNSKEKMKLIEEAYKLAEKSKLQFGN